MKPCIVPERWSFCVFLLLYFCLLFPNELYTINVPNLLCQTPVMPQATTW